MNHRMGLRASGSRDVLDEANVRIEIGLRAAGNLHISWTPEQRPPPIYRRTCAGVALQDTVRD